jgi:hypothetical protein
VADVARALNPLSDEDRDYAVGQVMDRIGRLYVPLAPMTGGRAGLFVVPTNNYVQ